MSISEYTTRRRKVWIDTDAGTDDAIALMIAMSHPDVDIVGISTVGGNVSLDCVTQNVLYIKELYNNQAPVHAGAAQPLQRNLGKADFIHGKDGLGDIGLPLTERTYSSTPAEEAIIAALIEHHGDLEIITLGPLTNLAKAIQQSPEISSLIKHCYIMGGLITGPGNVTPHAEYNIWADPEAAQYILSAEMPMTTIGWDTTELSGFFTLEEIAELREIGTHIATIAADMQMVRINWQKSQGLKEVVTWTVSQVVTSDISVK